MPPEMNDTTCRPSPDGLPIDVKDNCNDHFEACKAWTMNSFIDIHPVGLALKVNSTYNADLPSQWWLLHSLQGRDSESRPKPDRVGLALEIAVCVPADILVLQLDGHSKVCEAGRLRWAVPIWISEALPFEQPVLSQQYYRWEEPWRLLIFANELCSILGCGLTGALGTEKTEMQDIEQLRVMWMFLHADIKEVTKKSDKELSSMSLIVGKFKWVGLHMELMRQELNELDHQIHNTIYLVNWSDVEACEYLELDICCA